MLGVTLGTPDAGDQGRLACPRVATGHHVDGRAPARQDRLRVLSGHAARALSVPGSWVDGRRSATSSLTLPRRKLSVSAATAATNRRLWATAKITVDVETTGRTAVRPMFDVRPPVLTPLREQSLDDGWTRSTTTRVEPYLAGA